MKTHPYLITLAVQTFLQNPRVWQQTLRVVKERNVKVPQTSFSLLQPALARSLDRDTDYSMKSSEELIDELSRRLNDYFGYDLLVSRTKTLELLLRLGCVLLRMKQLDGEPELSRLILDSGCVKVDLFSKNKSHLSKNNISLTLKKLKNSENQKHGVDTALSGQIASIFKQLPRSKMPLVAELARAVFDSIREIYNSVYVSWSSTKTRKIPVEFLQLISDKQSFINGVFSSVTEQLTNVKLDSINPSELPVMVLAAFESSNKKKSTATQYLNNIHHAQTLIEFYKMTTKSLKSLYSSLIVYQRKAPDNIEFFSTGTFEMKSLLVPGTIRNSGLTGMSRLFFDAAKKKKNTLPTSDLRGNAENTLANTLNGTITHKERALNTKVQSNRPIAKTNNTRQKK